MTNESIPSWALKVAELLNEARVEGDSRYTLRTSAVAFAKGAEFALNIARRDLASPPPQATGALSEPLTEAQIKELCSRAHAETWGREWLAFARAIEAAHGITAAPQVEADHG